MGGDETTPRNATVSSVTNPRIGPKRKLCLLTPSAGVSSVHASEPDDITLGDGVPSSLMIDRGNCPLWNRVENLRFFGPGVRHIARRDYGPARRRFASIILPPGRLAKALRHLGWEAKAGREEVVHQFSQNAIQSCPNQPFLFQTYSLECPPLCRALLGDLLALLRRQTFGPSRAAFLAHGLGGGVLAVIDRRVKCGTTREEIP